jgi:hypothetical protein
MVTYERVPPGEGMRMVDLKVRFFFFIVFFAIIRRACLTQ